MQEVPELWSLHQQVPHKAQNTNVNTVEEVNAIHAFCESPHHVQAELSNNDSFDVMYICIVNASKPRRHVFANLQLATQSSKPKYLKVGLDTAEICQ